jgi:rhodanese-related sulfurtransferase
MIIRYRQVTALPYHRTVMNRRFKSTDHAESEPQETKEQACLRMSYDCQQKFQKSVPALSSQQFIEQYNVDDVTLVDCRTKPEQDVSMIRGAIRLQDLGDVKNIPRNKPIITYCSVGYRSGLEGQRWKDLLGHDWPIYNLDGILAYTHALQKSTNPNVAPLVDPLTQQTVYRVHCFGEKWDCAAESYQTVKFSAVEVKLRTCQVVKTSAVRATQHLCHPK